MATAATVAAPFPLFGKIGPYDVGFFDGTMPADASGGLTWKIDWARVICAVVVSDLSVATADVGPFQAKYASGTLTAYGANAAAANDAHVIAIVIGNQ